jgi:hypothetical protein
MNMPTPDANTSQIWDRAMSEDEFYATRPERQNRGWVGYGVSWHQLGQPNIGLIYCEATEEAFAIRGVGDYLVLRSLTRLEFDKRLRGWEPVHRAQRPNSFEWVLQRL